MSTSFYRNIVRSHSKFSDLFTVNHKFQSGYSKFNIVFLTSQPRHMFRREEMVLKYLTYAQAGTTIESSESHHVVKYSHNND